MERVLDKMKYIPTKDKLIVTYVHIFKKQKNKLRATDLFTDTGYIEIWNFIVGMVYPDSTVSCSGSYNQDVKL
jgi:hypothetical protein